MALGTIQQAEFAFQNGDVETAAKLCAEILGRRRDDSGAMRLYGLVALKQGQVPTAIDRLASVHLLQPGDYTTMTWLQVALRMASRYEEAVSIGVEARSLWPDDPEVLASLGLSFRGARDTVNAVNCLGQASRLQPTNASIQYELAVSYEILGADADAAKAYQKAIELEPRLERAYLQLGKLLLGRGNPAHAIEWCDSAPRSAKVLELRALAFRELGDKAKAEESLSAAMSLDPQTSLTTALWRSEEGHFEEAANLYREAIRQKPVQGQAYAGLVRSKRVTEADRELVATMRALLDRPDLHPREKTSLHYGLGKALDDVGEYEQAIVHFDEANRLTHRFYLAGKAYDGEGDRTRLQKAVEMFSPAFMNQHRSIGCESDVPIFVVGMIRSGTTLVEQILASHPKVGAAGEQKFWLNEMPGVLDLDATTIDVARFCDLQARYLNTLRQLQPGAARVTDKMPLNFYWIGAIHLAFPNSPIVHVQRNAIDNALSIYMTELAKPPDFACDKNHIVEAYRQYLSVMSYWRKLIPSERLLEIRYEEIVSDQETSTRRLLEFCGLEWNAECLEFHRTNRPVATPSLWQVRQPIYRSSVERWKNYEPWLGPFAELRDVP